MPLTSTTWFNSYFTSGNYDEMFTPEMGIRPPWKALFSAFKAFGTEGLNARQRDMDWLLYENGVTYNVYNDPKGMNRPWDLNLVPFVLQEKEWKTLAEGLQQRATLLDLVLKDVYGKRHLIQDGIVPHEVIYGHRGFLRQCSGIAYNTEKMLSIYAADVSRGTDGRLWVVNDRTEAPSGMGYALENRYTSQRVLPELFAQMAIKPLSNFLEQLDQLLVSASPEPKDNPNIVILTPGSHNETYFEHAYLASYFGYRLVQGNDLVVRDGFLWMKSLKGLKKVDVVLRRVDDAYVDSLELREDSQLGVVGLLDVVRRKNVSVINPVGSAVMENPGLIPFMPAIANYFLKQELLLPQIASWWCGQNKEKQYVLDNLPQLVVKRIDRTNRESIHFGEFMTAAELEQLKKEINARPYRFVAQERIHFSTAPNLNGSGIEPRNTVARAFAIAMGDNYNIMPGGLVRVAPDRDTIRVSNQRGGTNKDFWVLEEGPVSQVPILQKYHKRDIVASGLDDLPSLTAENLYWAGRYVGRTLMTARYLRMVFRQMAVQPDANEHTSSVKLRALFESVTQVTGTYPGFVGDEEVTTKAFENPKAELLSVMGDKTRAGSLGHTIEMFGNSYYAIRNLWSSDMWRVFKSIQRVWRGFEADKTPTINDCIKTLDQLITRLIAFMGLVEESIMVQQGLLLYFIGLQLEQSMLTITKCRSLLTVKQEGHVEYELLEYLLASHESLNIYRYSYRSYIQMEQVMDLLLFDVQYPRSLAFMLNRLHKDVSRLPHSKSAHQLYGYQKHIFEAFSRVRLADKLELMKIDEEAGPLRHQMDAFFDDLSDLLHQASRTLSAVYFNHTQKRRQLVNPSFPI
ncbi:MAG: circularly permuted type 2 ATP-grasp protein [Bacteroidota bacterium]